MKQKISKANESLAYFNTRLDEIHMSDYERLRAKARFAQAEAMVDAISKLIGLGTRLLKALSARPVRRPSTSAG